MTTPSAYRYLEPAALARMQNLSLAARGVVEGFISGQHTSPFRGFSVEFAEHRNYVAGDNLRHLDWRMLGRTDRLYVKQYEEETNLKAQIVLDTSSSMAYRSGSSVSKLEYGAYLTAMLGYLMTRQQDAVGLTTFDEQLRLDMPPRSSRRGFGELLRQMEALCDQATSQTAPPRPAKTRIAETLHDLAERFKRRCLVILISDLYEDPEVVMQALHHFRHRHHELIVFHVFDEAEIEFPFRETTEFVDMETGEHLQVDPSYVREDYCRQVREFIDHYRRRCNESRIDYVMTHTSVPYDQMLTRYLAKRNSL